MRWLAILLVSLCTLGFAHGTASAQAGYDTRYLEAPALRPAPWSSVDEHWLERNRSFALAGKILTVVGVVGIIVGASADNQIGLWGASSGVQMIGQLMWSIAELRGAKQLRRRGVDVSKAPGIAAVVGAVLFSPVTWIAGPIQSARIREARESLPSYERAALSLPSERLSSFGFGLRLAL